MIKNPTDFKSDLNDQTLLQKTLQASKDEKSATFVLLEYLCLVDERRAYAIHAYSSLFDYVVRGLNYSESQAAERVNAVRLMRSTPKAKEHIEAGSLTLTTAAQIQRFVQAEKKAGS